MPLPEVENRSVTKMIVGSAMVFVSLYFLLGYHYVRNPGSTFGVEVVPKAELSFSHTLTSVEEVSARYRATSLVERARGNTNVYLYLKLRDRGVLPEEAMSEGAVVAEAASFDAADVEKVKVGMTYEATVGVLRSSGIELRRGETEVTYLWRSPDASTLEVMFRSGRVVKKKYDAKK